MAMKHRDIKDLVQEEKKKTHKREAFADILLGCKKPKQHPNQT